MHDRNRSNRWRHRTAFAAALLLALAVPRAVSAEIVNRILATVDGEPITKYELDKFTDSEATLRQLAAQDPSGALEALITKRLIDSEFKAQGLSVNNDDVNRYIESIRQRNNLTEEQLNAALMQQGITSEQYFARIRDELQRAQLINKEIRGKVNVTPEDVQRYYDAHKEDYSKPAQLSISHIVLQVPRDASPEQVEAVQQRADALFAQLQAGADFAELAKANSEDAAAKSGGELGTFKQGEMLEVVEEATKGLKPGEFSKPVRSDVGIHIVRLDEQSGESHEPLDSLADDIKEKLYNAALEERYARWLKEDLRERHYVEILP